MPYEVLQGFIVAPSSCPSQAGSQVIPTLYLTAPRSYFGNVRALKVGMKASVEAVESYNGFSSVTVGNCTAAMVCRHIQKPIFSLVSNETLHIHSESSVFSSLQAT